jgi:hypothetical protein
MHRFVLVTAALALAPNAAAADCMMAELTTNVITATDAVIPSDGGILVVSSSTGRFDPKNRNKNSDAVQPTWRMRRDTSVSAPKIDVLAPGLAVYRLPASPAAAQVTLEDDDQKVVAKVTASKDKPAPFAAPKLKKVEYLATLSRHSWQRIEATLDAEPPAGMYAIVIADTKGNAKSWGVISKGVAQFPYTHSDCGVVANGTSVPKPGEMVTVFFVDAQGRRSEASKPIKMGGKPNPY